MTTIKGRLLSSVTNAKALDCVNFLCVTLWPWPFDLEQLSFMTSHVTKLATKYEDPKPIRSWVTSYNGSLLKRPRQWSIHLLLHDVTTVTVSTMVQVQFTSESDLCKMCSTLQLDLLCVKESMTASPLISVTFYTGCPCSNTLNIRSVYLSISAFTRQLHCIWLRCSYQSQQFSCEMVYGEQYVEIWRSHDVIWPDTDKGASTSLDHHCGTLCCWLFVTYHWL